MTGVTQPERKADLLLPDILGQRPGPQRALELLLLHGGRLGRDQPVGFNAHPGILPQKKKGGRAALFPKRYCWLLEPID